MDISNINKENEIIEESYELNMGDKSVAVTYSFYEKNNHNNFIGEVKYEYKEAKGAAYIGYENIEKNERSIDALLRIKKELDLESIRFNNHYGNQPVYDEAVGEEWRILLTANEYLGAYLEIPKNDLEYVKLVEKKNDPKLAFIRNLQEMSKVKS